MGEPLRETAGRPALLYRGRRSAPKKREKFQFCLKKQTNKHQKPAFGWCRRVQPLPGLLCRLSWRFVLLLPGPWARGPLWTSALGPALLQSSGARPGHPGLSGAAGSSPGTPTRVMLPSLRISQGRSLGEASRAGSGPRQLPASQGRQVLGPGSQAPFLEGFERKENRGKENPGCRAWPRCGPAAPDQHSLGQASGFRFVAQLPCYLCRGRHAGRDSQGHVRFGRREGLSIVPAPLLPHGPAPSTSSPVLPPDTRSSVSSGRAGGQGHARPAPWGLPSQFLKNEIISNSPLPTLPIVLALGVNVLSFE